MKTPATGLVAKFAFAVAVLGAAATVHAAGTDSSASGRQSQGLFRVQQLAPNTAPGRQTPNVFQTSPGATHGGAGHTVPPVIGVPFQPNCAPGFFKAGEKQNAGDPKYDWFVCSTNVIQCPKQLQSNGKYSGIQAQAIIQPIASDPDGGVFKFRVQYKCDYSFTALPEG